MLDLICMMLALIFPQFRVSQQNHQYPQSLRILQDEKWRSTPLYADMKTGYLQSNYLKSNGIPTNIPQNVNIPVHISRKIIFITLIVVDCYLTFIYCSHSFCNYLFNQLCLCVGILLINKQNSYMLYWCNGFRKKRKQFISKIALGRNGHNLKRKFKGKIFLQPKVMRLKM